MKKGFTLVELAIVLVVIGLLMGMAFKGKSLVDAARIKAEINKVEKMGTAVSVYYSKYDMLPGVAGDVDGLKAGSPAAIQKMIIDEGLLKESDFKTATGNSYWSFVGCASDNASGWKAQAPAEGVNLCIFRTSKDTKTQTAALSALDSPAISGVNVCQIETTLDDKNLTTGDGRIVSGLGTGLVDNTTWNCADTKTNSANPVGITYAYRVF